MSTPGDIISAYQLAEMQAKTQMRGQDLDYAAKQDTLAQEQRQKFAQGLNDRIAEAQKTVATAVQAHRDKGGDTADPAFRDFVDPLIRQSIEASVQANVMGYGGTSPELVAQSFHNALNAPSRTQTATAEAGAEAIKTTAKTSATANATAQAVRDNQDVAPRVQAVDRESGRVVFATDLEIANSQRRLVPLQGNWQEPKWSDKPALNRKTGEWVQARVNDNNGLLYDLEGQPLGPDYLGVSGGFLQGTPGDMGLTTGSQTEVEKKMLGRGETIGRLSNFIAEFKKEDYQLGNQVTAAMLKTADYAGMDLNAAQEKLVTRQKQASQRLYNNLNATILEISGQAMGVQEAQRIMEEMPKPGDGPTAILAAAEGAVHLAELSYRRLAYFKKTGMAWDPKKGEPPVDLATFQSIMARDGEDIVARLKEENPGEDPKLLRQMAAAELAKKYDYGD